MNDTHPPTDHYAGPLLAGTQDMILRLISEFVAMMPAHPARPQDMGQMRWMARHLLVPAEALLRRALRVIAAALRAPALATPASPRAAASRTPSKAVPARPRRPAFRLFEPLPRVATPRAAPTAPANPRSGPSPAAYKLTILLRLNALRAAWADPLPLIERLLRLRMKSPRRTLAYARPPGFNAAPEGFTVLDIYRELNAAAEAAEGAPPDSS